MFLGEWGSRKLYIFFCNLAHLFGVATLIKFREDPNRFPLFYILTGIAHSLHIALFYIGVACSSLFFQLDLIIIFILLSNINGWWMCGMWPVQDNILAGSMISDFWNSFPTKLRFSETRTTTDKWARELKIPVLQSSD